MKVGRLCSKGANDCRSSLRTAIRAADNAVTELSPISAVKLVPVLNNFEDTYLGRFYGISPDGSVRRRNPLLPVAMWMVYERTLNGEARTNNFAGAAHRRMKFEFGVRRPTLWSFIDGLTRVQKNRDYEYEEFLMGTSRAKKRNKYAKADENILKLVRKAGLKTHEEYLCGIAQCFHMESS